MLDVTKTLTANLRFTITASSKLTAIISVGAQSTLGGGGQDIFARKYMHEKLTKCPNFTWYLPEKLTKKITFNKMSEFYMIFARKIFFPNFFFGGGQQPLRPSSPTSPTSMTAIMIDNRIWPSKPEILIYLKLWDKRWNSNGKSGVYDHVELEKVLACECDGDRQP